MRQAAHAPPPRPPWTLQFPPLYPPATLTHTPPQTTSTIRTHRCLPLSNHPPHSMQHSTLHSTPHPPEQQLRHGHPPVTQTRGSQCRAPSRAPQPLTAGPTVTSHHSLPMGAPLQTLHAMKPFALIELLMLRRAQERRSMHRTRRLQTTWRPLCHANALHPSDNHLLHQHTLHKAPLRTLQSFWVQKISTRRAGATWGRGIRAGTIRSLKGRPPGPARHRERALQGGQARPHPRGGPNL